MDLETMSLEELRDLRGKVDRAITGFRERRRREAIAAAEEAVKAHGFSLADLTRNRRAGGGRAAAAPAKTQAGAPGAARYAHPEDPSQTWTGRGRRPRWVTESLEAGKSLDDLAV